MAAMGGMEETVPMAGMVRTEAIQIIPPVARVAPEEQILMPLENFIFQGQKNNVIQVNRIQLKAPAINREVENRQLALMVKT